MTQSPGLTHSSSDSLAAARRAAVSTLSRSRRSSRSARRPAAAAARCAFHERVRARRGSQIAIVAVARKLAVLFWHLLTRERAYAYQRPSLTRKKLRAPRTARQRRAPPPAGPCQPTNASSQRAHRERERSSPNKPKPPTAGSSPTGRQPHRPGAPPRLDFHPSSSSTETPSPPPEAARRRFTSRLPAEPHRATSPAPPTASAADLRDSLTRQQETTRQAGA